MLVSAISTLVTAIKEKAIGTVETAKATETIGVDENSKDGKDGKYLGNLA